MTSHKKVSFRVFEHWMHIQKQNVLFLPFLVANDLDGDKFSGLVIQALQDLSEGSFSDHLQHLKPEAYVVMRDLQRKGYNLL